MNFQPNDVIDERYRVVSILGSGASGTVYLAEDELLKRLMSVKVLSGESASRAEKAERFHREAKILSQLNHPNIVSIHRYGFLQDGSPYLVLDFVEGHSLRHLIEQEKRFSLQKSADIVRQICVGLKAAAEKGIVHRDLKPENILVANESNDWQIKIIDFGLCKQISLETDPDRIKSPMLTQTGMTMGTLAYMSPEQRVGHKVDWRTDVYALGCIFFELLTGDSPLTSAGSANSLLLPKLEVLFEKKDKASAEIDAFIERCTAPIASNRFESHDNLLLSLDSLVRTNPEWSLSNRQKDSGSGFIKLAIIGCGIIGILLLGLNLLSPLIHGKQLAKSTSQFQTDLNARLSTGKITGIGADAKVFFNSFQFQDATEKRRFEYDVFKRVRNHNAQKHDPNDNASLIAIDVLKALVREGRDYALRKASPPDDFCDCVDDVTYYLAQTAHSQKLWVKIYEASNDQTPQVDDHDVLKRFVPGPELYVLRAKSAVEAGVSSVPEIKQLVVQNFSGALARYSLQLSSASGAQKASILKNMRIYSNEIIKISKPTFYFGLFLGNYFLAETCLEQIKSANFASEKLRLTDELWKTYHRCRDAVRTDAAEIESFEFQKMQSLLLKLAPLIPDQFSALRSKVQALDELNKITSDHLFLAEKFKDIALSQFLLEASAPDKKQIQRKFEEENVASGAFLGANVYVKEFYDAAFHGHLVAYKAALLRNDAAAAARESKLAAEFAKKSGAMSEQFFQILKGAQNRNYPK